MFDDSNVSGGSVGGFEDVGLLGQVVDEGGFAWGLRADDEDFEFSYVVHGLMRFDF